MAALALALIAVPVDAAVQRVAGQPDAPVQPVAAQPDAAVQPVAARTGPARPQWLVTVNSYRAGSGLRPVRVDPSWSAGITAHLRYLRLTPANLLTGQYANAHTENPASPYHTAAGEAAGAASDLAFATTGEAAAVDAWMAAPFHAIGILRPGLTRAAFARDGQGNAGLDVIRGLTYPGPGRRGPVVFPGHGATVHLNRFLGENPSPLDSCGYPSAGLPLIALLPQPPAPGSTATLTDAGGRRLTACVVDTHTYRTRDSVYGPAGRAILAGDNAVLVIPRRPLLDGRHTVRLRTPGQPPVRWTFTVTSRR